MCGVIVRLMKLMLKIGKVIFWTIAAACCGIIGLSLLFLLAIVCFIVSLHIPGCNAHDFEVQYVIANSFDDPRIEPAKDVLEDLIPPSATEIRAELHAGCFLGGAGQQVRCHVGPDAMRAFIKDKGWNFRYDSTMKNENEEYPDAHLGFCGYLNDFWDENESAFPVPSLALSPDLAQVPIRRKRPQPCSGRFWSYQYIYKNNGGYRLFYDVETETFYYDWSSN